MKLSRKKSQNWPKALIAAASKPHVALPLLFSSLRYRMQGWVNPSDRRPPEAILSGIAELGSDGNFKNFSFTFTVIALSAKVACADGQVTREQYIAFRDAFPLSGGECTKIRSLFTLACANQTPFEQYVTQIKYMFPHHEELFISLLERLFRIACADGSVSKMQEKIISAIAHMLDIAPANYAGIYARFGGPSQLPDKKLAHEILGLSSGAEDKLLKKRYRELMQRYHPDRFAGHDISPEVKALLQLKSSEINSAYRTLAKRSGGSA